MNHTEQLARLGLSVPDLYLPSPDIDYSKFAVIACDQYSARPEYWAQVKDFVGGAPSALNLILPEAFLGQDDAVQSDYICRTMRRYLDEGVFQEIPSSFVYLRRGTLSGVRRGLIAAFDMECYDFAPGASSMVRATEHTVIERLPARIAVRREAPLELPHVMVLIDDPEDCLMSLLESLDLPPLYDFPLMCGSGHLKGARVCAPEHLGSLACILEGLKASSRNGFLYAMGDGNHSFAAAKNLWEEIKKTLAPHERESHPARYSLAEIVNLHDPALQFEPIHRLLINVDPKAVQKELGFSAENPPDLQDFQPALDTWIQKHPEVLLEYIHGEEECRELGRRPRNLAVIFPPFAKKELFSVVAQKGAYVRKSFSMGESPDKRFYLEARKITR